MPAFVVILKSNKLISVRGSWVEIPILGEESRIFHSPNAKDKANFEIETSHFFHVNETACYIGRIYKHFETLEAADQWLHERPRRIPNVYKRFNQPNVVETLDLCEDLVNGVGVLGENCENANNVQGESLPLNNIENQHNLIDDINQSRNKNFDTDAIEVSINENDLGLVDPIARDDKNNENEITLDVHLSVKEKPKNESMDFCVVLLANGQMIV
ncbi:uncharacterized protein LOC116351196, partial [Contarinia nasturtii]|uniref:uncharacterized protein LOC116351196 n=1 Tax=Contarinia nasturtii TaxID=265458 RepID=UPI0012D4532F